PPPPNVISTGPPKSPPTTTNPLPPPPPLPPHISNLPLPQETNNPPTQKGLQSRKRLPAVAVARLRSVLSTTFSGGRNRVGSGLLGNRVAGTLFGSRTGHVHFAFQREPSSPPAFLIELATPISHLVKEMASGLVRIALECDGGKKQSKTSSSSRLLEEMNWRAYCNGKKCGAAARKLECGVREMKLLKSLEMVSMGAGVLPSYGGDQGREEIMYMRAKFERVVGSRDSEAFYMMNPDCNGAPELSIYLLRV
ncbi:Protein MIZU-KUSSEI 1, partial [Linum grandiflorum]